jgi:hypothetical protein
MARSPCKGRIVTPGLDKATATAMLAQAQQAWFDLLTGQMPSLVETPQLGRVAYQPTNIADLRRLMDYLGTVAGTCQHRRPFSFYMWP